MSTGEKIPVIAVAGPTASGKTALAVSLAQEFDAEVLSFDSMQLYKGMDIATAKPTAEEMQGVPHHMIDCVENTEIFSVAKYVEAANGIIDDIVSRGKRVAMAGGTGLYLDALLTGTVFLDDPEGEEKRLEIRSGLERELQEYGPDAMLEKLRGIDPETAEKLHPNNTGRVLRALEIYQSTGHTMSYQVEHSRERESRFLPVYIGLDARNRQFLYDRINTRVDRMLENGLLAEAREFAEQAPGSTARQAIGLKELMPYINGEATLEECTERIKQETRRYAKRQLTWFRRNQEIHWFFIDEMSEAELLEAAKETVREALG